MKGSNSGLSIMQTVPDYHNESLLLVGLAWEALSEQIHKVMSRLDHFE